MVPAMPEWLTLVLLGLMLTITAVIAFWAVLTLVTVSKSAASRTLYVLFSVFLAAEIGVALLLRTSFYSSYGSAALWAFLILVSLGGSLMLLFLGAAICFARWSERPFGTVIGACLSGAVFVALLVTCLR
jgi:hypothetical protein